MNDSPSHVSYDWPAVRSQATTAAMERLEAFGRERAERMVVYKQHWDRKLSLERLRLVKGARNG